MAITFLPINTERTRFIYIYIYAIERCVVIHHRFLKIAEDIVEDLLPAVFRTEKVFIGLENYMTEKASLV